MSMGLELHARSPSGIYRMQKEIFAGRAVIFTLVTLVSWQEHNLEGK